MKIAIVGSGIAGLGAAWALNQRHEITLFESEDYIGGHANTVVVKDAGRGIPVDTGFIVYNERNYPKLTRLFSDLDVPTQASEMSFSVSLDKGSLEYKGNALGILAQPANVLRPRFWRMIRDVERFYREAPKLLSQIEEGEGPSLGEYLRQEGYSEAFIHDHLFPMGAAIWSCSFGDMAVFPARTFVQFCHNHGLLRFNDRPQWRSVVGGSRAYVDRICREFHDRIRLNEAVLSCRRTPAGVHLQTEKGREERFDQLVLACHSDQALRILGEDALPLEKEILGHLRYDDNLAVLHADPGLMPRRRTAWASWNYLASRGSDRNQKATVTYWMNRLQSIDSTKPFFVSLNPQRRPRPEYVHASFNYSHPQFDQAALDAQSCLHEVQGLQRTWFCGAYCGYGFHEDGLEAGLKVAAELGAKVSWADEVDSMSPAWRAVQPLLPLAAAE